MNSALHVYADLEQGTEEWLAARRGIVTASVIGQMLTVGPPHPSTVPCPDCGAYAHQPCVSRARKEPAAIKTHHPARTHLASITEHDVTVLDTETSRALTMLLAAERITGWSDPVYVSRDMERGTFEEPIARDAYAQHAGVDVAEVGFMVREWPGVRLGYSPDGLVGDDGLIEIKSRRQKKHLATILADEVPAENMAQIQAGLLVSGRAWCDYVSFCGGMPLYVKRVHPDPRWHGAILRAVTAFEVAAEQIVTTYTERTAGMPATERTTFDMEIEV